MSYPCGLCKKDYSSPKRLEKHKCSYCFYCQRLYSTKQKFDSHNCIGKQANEKLNASLENSSNSNHVCEWCKKGFSSLNYLAAHKCPFCAVCDHIFASYQKYEMHKRKCARLHTSADIEPTESVPPPEPASTPVVTDYKCELCKKYFSSPKYLATHKCAYCEPCKRSFATFQKYRMHRLKCSRTIHSFEDKPEASATSEVTIENVNSLQDVVAARGIFITRKVISRMAMLELLRRRSGLSSINDLMESSEVAVTEGSDTDDQPEDLSCQKRSILDQAEDAHEELSQHLRGETTNYLLSRLSVSVRSQENSLKDSEDVLMTFKDTHEEHTDDRTYVRSMYFNPKPSSENDSVKNNTESLDYCSDERTGQSPCYEKARRHLSYSDDRIDKQSHDCERVHEDCSDDKMSENSPYNSERVQEVFLFSNGRTREQSPISVERTQEQSHNINDKAREPSLNEVDISEHAPYIDDISDRQSPLDKVKLHPCDDDDRIDRVSPHCVSELPEESFDCHSDSVTPLHTSHMPESSEVTPVEQCDSSVPHQNAVIAQLMEAVRSQFLLSAGSRISNLHFLGGFRDSHENAVKERISEMPRAKLIDSKPRGRMSAYAFFVQTCREEHKKKHPDENVVFSEFSRKCADRWKTMTDKEKDRFHEMAEKDKERYENEMKGYRGPRMPRGSRKRRNRKDPNAPKRALSAFFWFCNDERPKVRAANPDMGVGDVAKQLGAAWSITASEVKSKYEAMAENDKARYEREMKAFKEGNFGAKKLKTVSAPEEDEDDDSESEEEEEDDDDDEVE